MAQVAPAARPAFSLTTILSQAWTRFVRNSNQAMSKGIYGEDVTFSDSVERELNERELHPYSW